jgi:hypothetical protein
MRERNRRDRADNRQRVGFERRRPLGGVFGIAPRRPGLALGDEALRRLGEGHCPGGGGGLRRPFGAADRHWIDPVGDLLANEPAVPLARLGEREHAG